MDVYLVQHGQALSEQRDPQRPLSEEGRAAATRMADHLAGLGTQLIDPPIAEVRHSGKLRAQQTAEVFAQALCAHVRPTACEGMGPKDDPRTIYEELAAKRDRDGAVLLVGHLPHLARLAGRLLAGDAEKTPVRFVNAAVLKIGPADDGWAVEWYLTSACVR
jgi:phosphohistidine phosphatase